MRSGRAADHSPTSSAAVMEEWSYTYTHPVGHTGPVTGSLYLYLCVSRLSILLSDILLFVPEIHTIFTSYIALVGIL